MAGYNIDLSKLEGLSGEERSKVLEILKDFSSSGKSSLYDELLYADYKEIPVDIETFLTDPQYLGRGLVDSEGRFTVFPYWVKVLKQIFPTKVGTAYNTLVLTGGIGLGKSLCATLVILYYLYRVMCLKDANLHFGLQPMDEIWFSMMNVTLEAAQGVAWSKAQELLQSSPWFMDRGKIRGKEELVWYPNNSKLKLVFGSNNNKLIGKCLLVNFTDEVNFAAMTTDVEKIKKKQMRLISQIDARLQSRFMKGNRKPYINIIASSKDSEQAFMESFIDMKKKNESKTTLIIDEPQWVIRTDKDSPEKFWVAVGDKFNASEVLPKDAPPEIVSEYRDKGYRMLPVPIGYYENFQDNVELALTDIAGISTIGALKYISGPRFKLIKTDGYRNPFGRDLISTGTNDKFEYGDFFRMDEVSQADIDKPLFIHLDMSKSKDKTGIAGVWIKGRKEGVDESKEMFYKVAFSVSVEAPKGDELSFEKSRNFIRWLRDQGFNIKSVTADQYQSGTVLQQLRSDGFEAKELSVDKLDHVEGTKHKVCKPYQFFRSVIYERRIELYSKCDLLTDEVIGLEKEPDGHIEHPEGGTQGSKDQSDAVCGALYDASLHLEEYKLYVDNILEDTVEINDELDKDGGRPEDFAKAFEDDLMSELANRAKRQTSRHVGRQPVGMDESDSNWFDTIL